MNQQDFLKNSSNNSVDLFKYINITMTTLRETGISPEEAVRKMIGKEFFDDNYLDWTYIDWFDAQIIVFHETKKSIIERSAIYDA